MWPFADWDQSRCHGAECEVSSEDTFYPRVKFGFREGIPKSRCAPCSFDDYKAFLSKLVERYDGDGIEDMPGLEIPIKYYEILNEPEMKEDLLTFYKGTKEEYVEILKISYETIKSTCADCRVLQGGAAGISEDMIAYWRNIFELGGADYFDIANIHYVNFGDLDTLNVKDFKKLMSEEGVEKPIWVTEAEYAPGSDVQKSIDGAFKEGAEKIFFTGLIVGKYKPEAEELLEVYEKVVECE